MPLCIIVEDHDDTRDGYAEYLKGDGFEVLTAASADELRKLIDGRRPDAILMDLQLPGVDGWELAAEIRADRRLRGTVLLAVSACVFPAERERTELAGFDAFLPKPCDPAEIVAELHRQLAYRRAE